MSDIMVGNGKYNYSAILRASGGVVFNPSNIPTMAFAGTPYIIVKHGDGDIRIMRWLGGGGEGGGGGFDTLQHSLNADDLKAVSGGGGPDDDDKNDPGGDAKPIDFGPTGPVYTPLDLAGIPERNYTNFYPQSYMPADPNNAYPTMGLLSNPATQPGLQGTDLYQPWSAKYGQNVAPASLWNYKPPSGLDVAAGPKVTFQK